MELTSPPPLTLPAATFNKVHVYLDVLCLFNFLLTC